MKRHATLLLGLALLLLAGSLLAQNPASVHWSLMLPDSGKVSSVSGNARGLTQTHGDSFQCRDYSNGPGPDQRWWPYNYTTKKAIMWGPDTTWNRNIWVQFAALPKAHNDLHADSLSIYMGAKGTDKIRVSLWYDTHADYSSPVAMHSAPLAMKKDGDSLFTFHFDKAVPEGDTLYVRLYAWNAGPASNSKYLYLRLCTLYGTTTAKPLPASALWACTTDTKQSVAVAGKVTAVDETLVNLNINQYTGYNGAQRLRIVSAPGKYDWPAHQTTQIDTVYVQFAVSPKGGASLLVTSLSLDLGCHSIDNFKANVWYSKEPGFLNPVQVPFQTADTLHNYLPRNTTNTCMTVTAEPNLLVGPEDTFYLRVYPWVHDNGSTTSGKYLTIQNVMIAGETAGGADFELPVVVTNPVTYISTTFATSGGVIASDGGARVTARGVCWGTVAAPTTADALTADGAGSGAFVSKVTGLTNGTTYYLRAYATNEAGTAYGEEVNFRTLDSLMVPTVTTVAANNIMVKSAKSGGTVTAWGGSDVTARGVCWNLTGDPTIADYKTENGTGIGAFTSTLSALTSTTTYYVRAWATNATGTGYGQVETFTTQAPAPAVLKVVAQDGSGDYTTVQAAFNDVPDFYTGMWCIYVKAGTYKEKLMLAQNKTNVVLKGENALTTILTYDDYAGKAGVGGTSNCYSTAIEADDFTAMDITFQNTVKNDGTFNDQQAVALRINGDRGAYYNCRLLGYQDTYYGWGGRGTVRTYMKECYIEGSVDFIFGRNINVFDHCTLHVNRNNGCITAPSTDTDSRFGLVFMDCVISADSVGFDGVPITSFHLGRPWQGKPQCVYLRCEEPASLSPEGWTVMSTGLNPFFAEYHCFGAGSNFFGRINGGIQLSPAEAAEYTVANIFARTSNPNLGYDWMPEMPIFTGIEWSNGPESLPAVYELSQNYPNPFNPVTTIHYALPQSSQVRITIYNILGARVATLVDRQQAAGRYSVRFDGLNLGSGTYFYRIDAGSFHQTRKMLLLK